MLKQQIPTPFILLHASRAPPTSLATAPLPGVSRENLVYRVGGKNPIVHVSWKVPEGIYFTVWTIWAEQMVRRMCSGRVAQVMASPASGSPWVGHGWGQSAVRHRASQGSVLSPPRRQPALSFSPHQSWLPEQGGPGVEDADAAAGIPWEQGGPVTALDAEIQGQSGRGGQDLQPFGGREPGPQHSLPGEGSY